MDLTPKRRRPTSRTLSGDASPSQNTPADAKHASSRPRLGRGVILLAGLVIAAIAGWLLDAPGLWLRTFAERSLRNNDPDNALAWAGWAQWHSPRDAEALLLAARADLQMNKNAAALSLVDQAAALTTPPPHLDAYRLMIAAQRGRSDAAEQLLNESAQIPLPPEAYEALIRCAQYQNDLSRAELILKQLEQSGQAAAIVAYHRGRNRELVEDFDGAVEYYLRAFATQPRMIRAAFRAGRCFYGLRNFERAEQMFRHARSSAYEAIAAIELADTLWEQNKLEEAWRELQPCLDDDPAQLQALYLQVDEYIDSDRAAMVAARIQDALGNSQPAVRFLQRALAYNHRDFEARALLIKNLRQLKNDREADALAEVQSDMVAKRQRCRQLRLELINDPNNIDKLSELAALYWEAESVAEARLAISEIFRLEPNCERAKQLLAKIDAEEKSRAQRRATAAAAP